MAPAGDNGWLAGVHSVLDADHSKSVQGFPPYKLKRQDRSAYAGAGHGPGGSDADYFSDDVGVEIMHCAKLVEKAAHLLFLLQKVLLVNFLVFLILNF